MFVSAEASYTNTHVPLPLTKQLSSDEICFLAFGACFRLNAYTEKGVSMILGGGDDDWNSLDELAESDLLSEPPGAENRMPTILGPGPAGPALPVRVPAASRIVLPEPIRVEQVTTKKKDTTLRFEGADRSIVDRVTPVVGVNTVPAQAVPSSSSKPIEWAKAQPMIVACVHTRPKGDTVGHGPVPHGLPERFAFIRQISQTIGAEFGLTELLEVHVVTGELNAASIQLPDGSTLDLQSNPRTNTVKLAQELRRLGA
jgi:hypothetical protein